MAFCWRIAGNGLKTWTRAFSPCGPAVKLDGCVFGEVPDTASRKHSGDAALEGGKSQTLAQS